MVTNQIQHKLICNVINLQTKLLFRAFHHFITSLLHYLSLTNENQDITKTPLHQPSSWHDWSSLIPLVAIHCTAELAKLSTYLLELWWQEYNEYNVYVICNFSLMRWHGTQGYERVSFMRLALRKSPPPRFDLNIFRHPWHFSTVEKCRSHVEKCQKMLMSRQKMLNDVEVTSKNVEWCRCHVEKCRNHDEKCRMM